ncbi:hypothetical protein OS493_020185 [Desmophyllum pertusum]|uniref:Uncharacterized protein n=1 Tax=Desmophyllum pertusum TaxID=174260 RepID=A0A9X0D8X4_9CNID|nr:hypothetical protein OS493_020185 [Desmophyllum pertusum]
MLVSQKQLITVRPHCQCRQRVVHRKVMLVSETANNSKTALSTSPKSGAQKNDASVTETANNSKTALSTSPKSGAEKNDASVTEKSGAEKDDASITEKASNTTVEKENTTAIKQKSVKVDFGTQSMKSMIGIIKVKTKPTDSSPSNESVVKDEKAALLNANEGVAKKEIPLTLWMCPRSKKFDRKTSVESKSSEEISVTEKETVLTNDLEANANAKVKNEEKMDMKATDADTPEKMKQAIN